MHRPKAFQQIPDKPPTNRQFRALRADMLALINSRGIPAMSSSRNVVGHNSLSTNTATSGRQ